MMRILDMPRASDSKARVPVGFQDHGEAIPAYRKSGKQFRAYTSEFLIEGRTYFTQVDATLADASGNAEGMRETEDAAFFLSHDLDYAKWLEEGLPGHGAAS